MGNAILPAVDPNPLHEGIQKIDRTTVTELDELATTLEGLQTALDNAEAGLSPLGIPEGGLAFDINPAAVVGTDNGTHFEQIYTRTKTALNNAVVSFDDAKNVTQLMRSEQDSLAGWQSQVASQEHAYNNSLIDVITEHTKNEITLGFTEVKDALPQSFIAGLAAGGDLTAPARAAMEAAGITVTAVMDWTKILSYIGVSAFGFATDTANRWTRFNQMAPLEWEQELRGAVAAIGNTMNDLNAQLIVINQQLRSYDDAKRKYGPVLK